jgi:hypothetical protein
MIPIAIVCMLPIEAVLISSYLMMYMTGFLAHIDTVGQRMYSRFSVELLGTFLLVKLNSEKTEIINVSKALQTHPKKYILGDQEINRVQSIKHLGITYQENGKINIEERLSICRRTIYALRCPLKLF